MFQPQQSQQQRPDNFVFIPGQNENLALRHREFSYEQFEQPVRYERLVRPVLPELKESSESENSDEMPKKPLLKPGVKGVPPGAKSTKSAKSAKEADADETETPLNAQEQLVLRKEIIKEYEALRQQYISEGEKARFDAREWAQRLIETTENDIRKLFSANEADCAELRKNANEQGYKNGFERGYEEGEEKGYSEGYNKALNECKDTLSELTAALQFIDGERDRYFKEYEKRLFDAVFTIASKITVDSLKQKDKAVITKMLREAAKGFRNSEYVKVTLSKLDVEQYLTTGLDELKEVFRSNQHIEFEVVKDAPGGTLILDDGSEITDAGVATQLMMIEKLGKGKFRDKTEDEQSS